MNVFPFAYLQLPHPAIAWGVATTPPTVTTPVTSAIVRAVRSAILFTMTSCIKERRASRVSSSRMCRSAQ
jgi:hypothetical protein